MKHSGMKCLGLLLSGLFGFSLAVATEAQAQRVSKINGKLLTSFCSNKKTVPLCDAYIAGIADSEVWSLAYAKIQHETLSPAFCIPKQHKTAQIRNIVVAWMGAHEDAFAEPAGKGVYRALHENYPCSSTLPAASVENRR